jgi:hypothetical protein
MRLYGTRRIAPFIRQKTVSTKYGVKARPLTAEDFEIVPEHDEHYLMEIRCEICGVLAPDADVTELMSDGIECNSFLLCLEVQSRSEESPDTFVERTGEFLQPWYEVCETCMRAKIVPFLNSLRRDPPAESPAEEPALLPPGPGGPSPSVSRTARPLIGEEDEENAVPSLPPLADDEPF